MFNSSSVGLNVIIFLNLRKSKHSPPIIGYLVNCIPFQFLNLTFSVPAEKLKHMKTMKSTTQMIS